MKTVEKVNVGKGILALLLAASFLFVSIVPAVAGRHGSQEEGWGKGLKKRHQHRSALGIWQNPELIETLGLTDNQVTQLKDSDFTLQEKRLGLKAQLDAYRLEMRKAFSGNSIDENAVRQLAKRMADVKGDLYAQKIESRLAIARILNPDQIGKLKTLKRQQKKKGRHCDEQSGSKYGLMERPCGNNFSAAATR